MVSLSVTSTASDVCTTPGCIQSAVNVLADMDFNIDPCSDFYQYTCGGWLRNATIPDSESSVGTFFHLRDANFKILEKIVSGTFDDLALTHQNEETRQTDQSNFNMLKDYYQACMNENILDGLGVNPLANFLLQLSQVDTLQALVHLERTGMPNPLFAASVDPDDKDPNINVITLMQPSLGLPSKEYFEQQTYLDVYGKTMKRLATLVLPDMDSAMVDRVMEFEIRLAKISTSLEELQDPIAVYNPFTLEELENRFGFLDWREYFDGVVPGVTPKKVVVITTSYFDQLNTLWKETDVTLINNYILLSTMRRNISYLDKTANDVLQEMNIKLSGRKTAPARTRTCIQRTNEAFGELMGHYFVSLVFGDQNDTSVKVQEQLDTIHAIYAQRLESVDWLDEATREKALEKIKKMTIKSMYSTVSPDIRSPISLQKFYGDLPSLIRPDTQFENTLAVSTWAARKAWSSLSKPVDKDRWFMQPQDVNAYFSPTYNQVVVPAGILQPPFFDINSDPLSLGGIGVVIGHELTHGFDNSGRLYDAEGVLSQWWSNATKEQFIEKAQCFIDQYNGFSIEGPDGKDHHVNGKMTLGENLADNGGISLAYEAFSKSYQMRLPGIDFSPEALFFINFGRVWCEKDRPERAIQKILGDVHSPARVRVNAAVQNMPAFAKAFDCAVGSPMNPVTKCKVW